jgi:hypothetical protein
MFALGELARLLDECSQAALEDGRRHRIDRHNPAATSPHQSERQVLLDRHRHLQFAMPATVDDCVAASRYHCLQFEAPQGQRRCFGGVGIERQLERREFGNLFHGRCTVAHRVHRNVSRCSCAGVRRCAPLRTIARTFAGTRDPARRYQRSPPVNTVSTPV